LLTKFVNFWKNKKKYYFIHKLFVPNYTYLFYFIICYLFILFYLFDFKKMCDMGLTMGDIQNQATELLHAIINSICDRGVKKGLGTQALAQKVIEHFILNNLLTLEQLACMISPDKSERKGIKIPEIIKLYQPGFPFPKKQAVDVEITNSKKESCRNIKRLVRTYVGKADQFNDPNNFCQVTREIKKGKNQGKTFNNHVLKFDTVKINNETRELKDLDYLEEEIELDEGKGEIDEGDDIGKNKIN
jgi:hypothetical protein